MADSKTIRIKPAVLTADTDTVTNLEDIADYAPANAAYTLAKAKAAVVAYNTASSAETRAAAALKTARDNAVAAEQALHTMALGVRDQVVAQYGSSSNEVQSIGRKKKSERKTPTRKPAAP